MNSWEGRNANAASGTWGGNESDGWSGWGWREQKTIIAVMNESGGRSPQAVTQSLRQDPVAPRTSLPWHSHINTLLRMRVRTRLGVSSRILQSRSGFSGSSQTARTAWLSSSRWSSVRELIFFRNYRHFALCIMLTAHRRCLLSIKRKCYSSA